MSQQSKPTSEKTPFAVFANQAAGAARPRPLGTPATANRGPQLVKSLENLVAQGNTALGSGNVALAQLRAKQTLQQFPDYMPALMLLRKCLATAEPASEEHENVLRRILQLDPN